MTGKQQIAGAADMRIYVIADDQDGDGVVEYTLTQDLRDPRIRVEKGNIIKTYWNEVFRMKFILCDNTDRGLRFDRTNGPIWLTDSPRCPDHRGMNPAFSIVGNPRKRRFELANSAKPEDRKDFYYRLIIIDKNGNSQDPNGNSYDFDPIIQNGGGGQEPGPIGPVGPAGN